MAIREEDQRLHQTGERGRQRRGRLLIFGRPTLLWENAPTTEDFYRRMGFDEVHTLDVSAYEGATIIHDLNSEDLPAGLEGTFDEVVFGGTAEHVYNVGAVFRSAARLVKVGGVVVAGAPANNWLDHGFYQLCPTLKFDFFNQNGFELGTSKATLGLPGKIPLKRTIPLYPGEAGTLNFLPARVTHTLVATRLASSTWDRMPLQSLYQAKHSGTRNRWRFRASEPCDFCDGAKRIAPMLRISIAAAALAAQDGYVTFPFKHAKAPPSGQHRPFRSPVLVYEDGELLPWIVSDAGMLAERAGSFLHTRGMVSFTASDGTDPRMNGRAYEVAIPAKFDCLEPYPGSAI